MKTRRRITAFLSENSALAAMAVVFLLAVVTCGESFIKPDNLINILRNNAIIGVVSLGMTVVIINGSIDLSVGSQLALIGLIALLVINSTQNIFLGILVAVVSGVIFGIATGAFVAKFRIPAFIVTLGTLTIYRSLAQYFFNGSGLLIKGGVSKSFTSVSNGEIVGIPFPVIYWLIIALVLWVIMNNTAVGRYIYAVGSNEKAARFSGIGVNGVKVAAFTISGIMIAFAAIIEAARLGSMNSASSGLSYEMDAIAAAVIGGTSMSGGKGKITGTVFGTLTIGIINNMMNIFGVPPFLVGAVKGGIIILAVLFQKRLDKE